MEELTSDGITFTSHALIRMAERGVSKAEVIEVILYRREKVVANEERLEARGLIKRDGKQCCCALFTNTVLCLQSSPWC